MATEEYIEMSQKEVLRLQVVEKLNAGGITQKEASKILNVSSRQIRRIFKEYKHCGVNGLISKKRGKPSNNKICSETRRNILVIIKEKYIDFGPTFLQEKLQEEHNFFVSKETLRKWMIEEEIFVAKRRKKMQVHQMRERRSCFGELIQIDGSPHDWFEGRGEKCCLLVFIDDATGKLVNLHFEASETTVGYFKAMREYINKFGLPMAFYSDRDSIFRINATETKYEGVTQFERAIKTLGVETLCANSPQAKGRVERANGILQDRLVKEMRLRGISNIKTANAYLPEFMESYNKKFSVVPKSDADAHVKLREDTNLDFILSLQYIRTLSKNLELSYNNVIYQIKSEDQGYGLRHAKIIICEDLEGKIRLIYKGKELNYSCYKKQKKTAEIVEAKALNHKIDSIAKKTSKPNIIHPWRQYKTKYDVLSAGC